MSFAPGRLMSLRLRWLWLTRSYRFRWAHRPLCSRFASGVISLAGVKLCRSCFALYLGAIATAAALALSGPLHHSLQTALPGLILPVLLLSAPGIYSRQPRAVRDLLRLGIGAGLSMCGYALLTGSHALGLGCAGVMYVFYRIYRVFRKSARAKACISCPELDGSRVCSGCAIQADAARRYEADASALLTRFSQRSKKPIPASGIPVQPQAD